MTLAAPPGGSEDSHRAGWDGCAPVRTSRVQVTTAHLVLVIDEYLPKQTGSNPLSMSMPVLNVVDVIVAIGLGAWAFGEPPASGPVELAVHAAALATMAVGLHQIALTHKAEAFV